MRKTTAPKAIEYGGLYGVPVELPPSSRRARGTSSALRPVDWRYIAETEGKEAAVRLLDGFEVVFHKPPTTLDMWRYVCPKYDNLPPGYERRVKSVVKHEVEMTRRDYSSRQAWEKALAKGVTVKRWWVVTFTVMLHSRRKSHLFRDITGVGV